MIPLIILITVVMIFVLSNNGSSSSELKGVLSNLKPGLTESESKLVSDYSRLSSFRSKAINFVHIVLPFSSLTDSLIKRILGQSVKVDMMTVIVPEKYETDIKSGEDKLCHLVRNTCLVQISGGLSMLAKERNRDTVLVFVKNRPDVFSNSKALEQILTAADSNRKPIVHFSEAVVLQTNIDIDFRAIYNLKL